MWPQGKCLGITSNKGRVCRPSSNFITLSQLYVKKERCSTSKITSFFILTSVVYGYMNRA